jgi:GH25 family lysozyme M1 (1,4-beta-N-acetylmuramidase)
VAAYKWKVKPVQEFLLTGKNYWQYIADWVGVELTESNKHMLKQATYAITYGASNRSRGRNKIREALWYMGKDKHKRFMESPLVQALHKAAKRQLRQIKRDNGASDCLGNWLPLNKVEVNEEWKDPRKSLLAQVNQSFEAMLLYPALELAIRHQNDEDGFYLSLYQYDGISITAKKPERTEYWANKVREAVNENARWWNICTSLEFPKKTTKKGEGK